MELIVNIVLYKFIHYTFIYIYFANTNINYLNKLKFIYVFKFM